jgi:hypothetical protein
MGWNELNDRTKKYIRNIAIAGGIALAALIGSGVYSKYNRHLCNSMATNAEAEQIRDKTLEKHIEGYCKERRKADNVDACAYKIVSVKDCYAEAEYKLDKVNSSGKPAGCLTRTFAYEYNPLFEEWSEGERLSQNATDKKCSYRPRRRKKTLREKAADWLRGKRR